MNISYNKNLLRIDGKSVSFPFDIYKVLVEDAYLFVLLSIPRTKEYQDYTVNIYGLRQSEIIWQVEDPRIVYPGKIFTAFENIYLMEGKLVGSDFYGLRCIINKKTGKIDGRLSSLR